jgi:hypothetical protein
LQVAAKVVDVGVVPTAVAVDLPQTSVVMVELQMVLAVAVVLAEHLELVDQALLAHYLF